MRKLLTARLVFILGICVFVAVKTVFILSQTAAMGMPRLGDDAYFHLWRAAQIEQVGVWGALQGDFSHASRAVQDIGAFCLDTPEGPASVARNRCLRLASENAVADPRVGASLLLNAIQRLDLSQKWQYAVFELTILAVIAASFAFFLLRLVGPPAAGIGLVLLSFMTLLPPQGLHQFIPSVLAIGLSMALWGVAIGSTSWRRYLVAAVGFLIVSRIHAVGLVFGGGLAVLAAIDLLKVLKPKQAAGVVIAIGLSLVLFLAVVPAVRTILFDALRGDLSAILIENLRALPGRLARFGTNNWGFVAAVVTSLIFSRRLVDRKIVAAGSALLALLAASLLYKTAFFTFNIPLDLFARVFVGFVVVLCGFAGKAIAEVIWDDWPGRKALAVAAVVLLPLPSVPPWIDMIFGNVNGRGEVIDQVALAGVIGGFDRNATLAYGELDITSPAAFLAGAHAFGAIPLQGLDRERLTPVLADRRPAAVALPNFTILNSLAASRTRSLRRRRNGMIGSAIDTMAVSLRRGPINTVFLRVRNDSEAPATLGPITAIAPNRQPQRLNDVTVPAGFDDWVTVGVGFLEPARTVVVNLPDADVWISGIAVNTAARKGVNWPWDSKAVVQWHARGLPRGQVVGVEFAPNQLFRFWRVPEAQMLPLRASHQVISDESGIVFIATDYPPAP